MGTLKTLQKGHVCYSDFIVEGINGERGYVKTVKFQRFTCRQPVPRITALTQDVTAHQTSQAAIILSKYQLEWKSNMYKSMLRHFGTGGAIGTGGTEAQATCRSLLSLQAPPFSGEKAEDYRNKSKVNYL